VARDADAAVARGRDDTRGAGLSQYRAENLLSFAIRAPSTATEASGGRGTAHGASCSEVDSA
jgi:hypothetical protein